MNRELLFQAIGSIAAVITAVFTANEIDRRTDRRASKRLLRTSKAAKRSASENANTVRASSRKAALKAKGPLTVALVSGVLLLLAIAHAVGIVALVIGLFVVLLGVAGFRINAHSTMSSR